jgi:hypothetical protein
MITNTIESVTGKETGVEHVELHTPSQASTSRLIFRSRSRAFSSFSSVHLLAFFYRSRFKASACPYPISRKPS